MYDMQFYHKGMASTFVCILVPIIIKNNNPNDSLNKWALQYHIVQNVSVILDGIPKEGEHTHTHTDYNLNN